MTRKQAQREALRIAYGCLEAQDDLAACVDHGKSWSYEDLLKIQAAFDAITQRMYERSVAAGERA